MIPRCHVSARLKYKMTSITIKKKTPMTRGLEACHQKQREKRHDHENNGPEKNKVIQRAWEGSVNPVPGNCAQDEM